MHVVDTNVLVHAANEDSPLHAPCRDLVVGWRSEASAWYTTWGILYEFLRVTTHPRVLRSPWSVTEAWKFLEALLQSSGLQVLVPTERHAEVVSQVFGEIPQIAGNLVHAAHTAVLMREHGIRRIVTRDTDFHRFPFLDPVDPVSRGRSSRSSSVKAIDALPSHRRPGRTDRPGPPRERRAGSGRV